MRTSEHWPYWNTVMKVRRRRMFIPSICTLGQLGLFLLIAYTADAKVEPVRWQLDFAPGTQFQPGSVIEARIIAEIRSDLHICSLSQQEGGPRRTEIIVPQGQPFTLVGDVVAPTPCRRRDRNFDIDLEYYTGTVIFLAHLRIGNLRPISRNLLIEVSYQACSEENCYLAKTVRLSHEISPATGVSGPSTTD